MATTTPARVGFIGLDDLGLPMATAVARAGFELNVWARRHASQGALDDAPFTARATLAGLAAASDIVLCMSTDDDVLGLAADLVPHLRPGSLLVNHGTGTPRNAVRLAELCASLSEGGGVGVIDAPVTGGPPAAESRTLVVLVGGTAAAAERAEPVFRSFASHVVHLGGTGSGQMAKLFNNVLLMMNQASMADIFDIAAETDIDAVRLFEALKLGSASSAALTLMNTMITPKTVDHLAEEQTHDMEIFDEAMRDAAVDATAALAAAARALSGTRRLHEVTARLNPGLVR